MIPLVHACRTEIEEWRGSDNADPTAPPCPSPGIPRGRKDRERGGRIRPPPNLCGALGCPLLWSRQRSPRNGQAPAKFKHHCVTDCNGPRWRAEDTNLAVPGERPTAPLMGTSTCEEILPYSWARLRPAVRSPIETSSNFFFGKLAMGIEPTTVRLRSACSANWALEAHAKHNHVRADTTPQQARCGRHSATLITKPFDFLGFRTPRDEAMCFIVFLNYHLSVFSATATP
jgi:hypothetical protein